jgi:diadenosine tetraphosphate (Ap4A) HIT family hydrolase
LHTPNYIQRIEAARSGTNPAVICRVPSGWVFLANMQYLRGYCILQSDPVVESINSLASKERDQYSRDMALVGDALLEVTNAYRINYATLGNTEPVLHTHIVPRYLDEPEEFRANGPWSYPLEFQRSILFDLERDRELMELIGTAIQKCL